jgi:hypothetical protein
MQQHLHPTAVCDAMGHVTAKTAEILQGPPFILQRCTFPLLTAVPAVSRGRPITAHMAQQVEQALWGRPKKVTTPQPNQDPFPSRPVTVFSLSSPRFPICQTSKQLSIRTLFQSRRGKSAGDIRSASPPRTCIVTAAYDVLTVDASPVESRVAAMEIRVRSARARHRKWLDHAPSLAKAHHVRLRDYCVCSGG